jgi:endonuclease G
VSTTSTTLQTATFTVNSSTAVRFEFRKVSGGANRLNLDQIQITAFASPTPTPTPTTTPTPPPPPPSSVHLTMGNPSGAVSNAAFFDNYLMVKPQYVLAYHRDRGTPVWTSWHLDATWLGTTPRQDDFRADTTLPAGWYQVQGTDYSGSGYDRGHMTPSADRTKTVADNSSTFLMTNMIPQLPANNQGPWAALESYCRTLVNSGNELYIVSGGYGIQATIASGHVTVPSQTWKVIIVLASGTNDASRVTTATRTIAVIMPNSGAINSDWRTYRVSVDQVEALTGFDFFSNVADPAENFIEAIVDNQ